MDRPFVIAIDGPAASGKGTLARKIAAHLGLAYLDTGKLYRAVGFNIRNADGSADTASAADAARRLAADELRNPALEDESIGKLASIVAAIPEVRDALRDFQRNFAEQLPGAVLDGRDIGTVICPNADIKLFITASLEARADRRFKELQKKEFSAIYDNVYRDLKERDDRDTLRASSPLVVSDDAIYIDTTDMDAENAFRYALGVVVPQLNPSLQKTHHSKCLE